MHKLTVVTGLITFWPIILPRQPTGWWVGHSFSCFVWYVELNTALFDAVWLCFFLSQWLLSLYGSQSPSLYVIRFRFVNSYHIHSMTSTVIIINWWLNQWTNKTASVPLPNNHRIFVPMLINNSSKSQQKCYNYTHMVLLLISLITSREPLLLHHTCTLTYKYTTLRPIRHSQVFGCLLNNTSCFIQSVIML